MANEGSPANPSLSGAQILAKLLALGALGAAFTDSAFAITGSSDATKIARFEVDGFTTGTTRTFTLPDASITIAGINLAQTFTAAQTIDENLTVRGDGNTRRLGFNFFGTDQWGLYVDGNADSAKMYFRKTTTNYASFDSAGLFAVVGAVTVGTTFAVTGASSFSAAASVDIGTANGARPSVGSPLINSTLTVFATDGQSPRIWGEGYGSTGLTISGRAIAGTRGSPTATSAGLNLFAITATGYDGTSYLTSARANYAMLASTLWTSSNHETHHDWKCTPNGATASVSYMQLRGGGRLLLGTTLPTDDGTSALQVTGAVKLSSTLTIGSATLIATTTSFTNGAAAQTATMTNGPAAGNPTKWIPVDDNGTTRYIPAW